MQLQQLRYAIAAAEAKSFREAAQKLFVSQSALSVAIKDLEQETGVKVFNRTSHGTTLTNDGVELIEYARRVVEQANLMEQRYFGGAKRAVQPTRFSVSSQHYSMVVQAFDDFIKTYRIEPRSHFALHETYANQIIRDVSEGRAELGFMYISNYNDRVIMHALDQAELNFRSLFVSQPCVYVRASHSLAKKDRIKMSDLDPFYRVQHEQGMEGSTYFAEEPLASVPHARNVCVSDNETLLYLLHHEDAYTLATGVYMGGDDIVSIPLEDGEYMNVGVVFRADRTESTLARDFMTLLGRRVVAQNDQVEVGSYAYECARRSLLADDLAGKRGDREGKQGDQSCKHGDRPRDQDDRANNR